MVKRIREVLAKYQSPVTFGGYNTRGEWQGDTKDLTNLWDLMAQKRHLLGRAWFFNLQHSNYHIDRIIKDLSWACKKIQAGYKSKLPVVKFSFRRNP